MVTIKETNYLCGSNTFYNGNPLRPTSLMFLKDDINVQKTLRF